MRRPPGAPGGPDRLYLEQALERALGRSRGREPAAASAFTTLEAALLDDLAPDDEAARAAWHEFVARFQQLTGPAMAKGVEDTAHYIHVPLVSRNEVGGEPDHDLADAAARLHRLNAERLHGHPSGMVTVSTHDTKRSADVRARLDVLSESADEWGQAVLRWAKLNEPHRIEVEGRHVPDRNTEYLLYQTLIGIWPVRTAGRSEASTTEELGAIRERVQDYMLKAVREAKRRTSWVEPDPDYEAALHDFIQRILSGPGDGPFLAELNQLATRIARPGFWNALARTLIQLTVPGTPDTYQGDELWNLSLVDPDNRRPVDFELRQRLLDLDLDWEARPESERVMGLDEMVSAPEDGRLKMRVMRGALGARRSHPELFEHGDYVPLQISGHRAGHLFAFARRLPEQAALIAAPTRATAILPKPTGPPAGAVWSDTRVELPAELAGKRWVCALSGGSRAALEAARGPDPMARLRRACSPRYRPDRGPAKSQTIKPSTGRKKMRKTQSTLAPVVARLCKTLVTAQMSAIRMARPMRPLNPPNMVPPCGG